VGVLATFLIASLGLPAAGPGIPIARSERVAVPALEGRATLARAYDAILDARFADARTLLAACPDAPPVACRVLEAARVWWAILLDPDSRALDREFSAAIEAAIAQADAWTAREPKRAEAWFYAGAAYAARVQWFVLRGERLAAARDGKRIKEALEQALALDPGLHDANFGIGLYQYYAAVAPPAARLLRWLLLLPGGNRAEGLRRMLDARARGDLVRDEADYQLHLIYLWYEKDVPRALELLDGLRRRHPGNPLFPLLVAEVHDVYLHDPTSSAAVYRQVLDLARRGAVNQADLAAVRAHLGLARHLDTLFESDRALEHARAVIAAAPPAPYGALAEAYLRAGIAAARLGDAAEAARAFDRALAAVPADDPRGLRSQIRTARRLRIDPAAGEAYRLALAGWRAYERHALDEAERLLARAVALRPDDPVARYRYGHVLASRDKDQAAIAELEKVASAGATTPPPIYAEACVDLAELLEARGDHARALALYRRAAGTFGAAAATRDAAARAAARLRG
jgi:tetratricopeptide (TPR) repeat protein